MGFRFDPEDRNFVDDPYPTYKILRDEHPVCRHEPSGFYVITRNEDVARILNDFETFSSSRGIVCMCDLIDVPLDVCGSVRCGENDWRMGRVRNRHGRCAAAGIRTRPNADRCD